MLNLLIALAGLAAVLGVEVRELPDIDRPVVTVRGNFPGASPETVDVELTALVEGAVARVAGVKEVRSSSEENNFRMRVVFAPDVDLDAAASDVREAVSRVERQLPEAVEQLTVIKADADASPIVRLAASSGSLSEEALTRIVEKDVIPALVSIDGVATVNLFGDRERRLRVVVDPLRLTSFGLSVGDVAAVLRSAPFDLPAGSFRSEDQELIVRADATVVTADQVRHLILRDTVTIGDVAEVFFGAEDAQSYVREDGRRVLGLGIVRQARSNTLDISDGVTRAVERLNDRFDEVEVTTIADDATFIRGSVREVVITLSIAVAIVVATIWLFIGSLRATLIPTVAIPLALIGTVAAIWLAGFSINLLTLLALVLATGMIVDDSIVVLENIQRRRARRSRAARRRCSARGRSSSRWSPRPSPWCRSSFRSPSCRAPPDACSGSSGSSWRSRSPSLRSLRFPWCRRSRPGCRRARRRDGADSPHSAGGWPGSMDARCVWRSARPWSQRPLRSRSAPSPGRCSGSSTRS